ncbi:ClpB-like protein [hydrothermal vent metagenome]|uniref:ClpB-like protein n=1 Tax=hydrothermal vent metagenome TaxID=652676 RepID=A0A3B0WHU8_9ZZZZ
MLRVDLAALIGSLNNYCKHALEEASSLCISQHGTEVTASHFLYKLIENPFSDVRIILKNANLDSDELQTLIMQSFDVRSEQVADYPSFSPLLIELLQEAWLVGSLEFSADKVRSGAVFYALLNNASRYLPLSCARYIDGVNSEALRKNFNPMLELSGESETDSSTTRKDKTDLSSTDTALDKYGINFTRLAEEGKIDPVLCRDDEIDMMIDILSRRRKNNPIAVGDAGVGKSALVEGLALRIHHGKVPQHLLPVILWGLDLGALQAGASVKGEFEKRLKSVIEEVKNSPVPIILFIDEAHTLVGAGGQAGGSDAANLLKPALARGELRTIAATTWSEYKKYFEKDPALSRRFQLVKLDEPSVNEAVHILRGLRSVYITESAIQAAAKLSDRYISGRQLPDKAIDVLDTACARVSTALNMPPRDLNRLENQSYQIAEELKLIERDNQIGNGINQDRINELNQLAEEIETDKKALEVAWEQQKEVVDQLIDARAKELGEECIDTLETPLNGEDTNNPSEPNEPLHNEESDTVENPLPSRDVLNTVTPRELIKKLAELQHEQPLIHADVDQNQIAAVIADWTGIPINTITGDELDRITNLPVQLKSSIKGQDQAIELIHKHLLTAMADLRRAGRPLGAFLLVGPSGVGKTETAIQIADYLFGGRQFMTVINMSEYQEKHTLSRLIGSPPGYVGFGEGGILSEAIRQRPYSVVLLDEVEKAHPDVLNLFYQAFDKGEFADGEGRVIDCKNNLFFLTSNIGFDNANNLDYEAMSDDDLRGELMNFFRPALLARMQVVRYLSLDDNALIEIIEQRLSALVEQFRERYNAELVLDDKIKETLRSRCIHHENGARMLDSGIDGELLPPLSLEVLKSMAEKRPINKAFLNVDDGQFSVIIE